MTSQNICKTDFVFSLMLFNIFQIILFITKCFLKSIYFFFKDLLSSKILHSISSRTRFILTRFFFVSSPLQLGVVRVSIDIDTRIIWCDWLYTITDLRPDGMFFFCIFVSLCAISITYDYIFEFHFISGQSHIFHR